MFKYYPEHTCLELGAPLINVSGGILKEEIIMAKLINKLVNTIIILVFIIILLIIKVYK